MKFSAFKIRIVFSMLLLTLTIVSFAQENVLDKEINIDVYQKSIIEVLKKIEDITSLEFFYNSDIIPEYTIISIKPVSNRLEDILNVLFKTAGLGYELKENQIIVFKQKNLPIVKKQVKPKQVKTDHKITEKHLSDFSKKYITIYDTVYTVIYDTITEKIYDTLIVYLYDTVNVIIYDTLLYIDTVSYGLKKERKIDPETGIELETSVAFNIFDNQIEPVSYAWEDIGVISNKSGSGKQSFFIDVSYYLNYNNWRFNFGSGFLMLHESFDYSGLNPHMHTYYIPRFRNDTVQVKYVKDIYYSDEINDYIYIYGEHDSIGIDINYVKHTTEILPKNHNNNYYFMNIPFTVSYNYKLSGNYKIGLYGKFTTHLLIAHNAYIVNEDYSLYKLTTADFHRIVFSYDMGFSSEYNIRQLIYFRLLLGYNQFFNSLYKDKTGFYYNPKYLRTSIGFIYRFK